MIESIHLTNFQCWKKLDIDLAPFVVILGQSGSGKTSIVRSFDNFVQCKVGSEYITHGKSRSRIEFVVDGHTVGWVKGDGQNEYYLDAQMFQKVGRAVPEDIEKLLNLPSYELEDEKFNLSVSMQFDPPFMVFDSPQRAARIISLISGVDKLLEVSKQVARDVREDKATVDRLKADKDSLENDTKFLDDLSLAVKWTNLSGSVAEYRELESFLENLLSIEVVLEPLEFIEFPDISELRSLQEAYDSLPSSVPAPQPEINFDRVDELASEYTLLLNQYDEVDRAIATHHNFLEQENVLSIERQNIEKEAAEVGDVCPLCGSPVSWI